MRSGPGNQFKITRTLPTGTALTILEESEDGTYSLARTNKGEEGWVLNQYLMNQPVAKSRLAALDAQHEKLQKEYDSLKKQFDTLSKESSSLSKSKDQLDQERSKLTKELEKLREVAARPLELEQDNSRMREELIALKNTLRIAEEKNMALEDSSERQWFGVGAAVLFFGIILGLLAPKLRGRKRGMWNEL
jgi:SH3 domain protein